jgi:hypothetical protein
MSRGQRRGSAGHSFSHGPRTRPLGACPLQGRSPALDGRGLGRVDVLLGLLATPTSILPRGRGRTSHRRRRAREQCASPRRIASEAVGRR